jgi:hypothetical protein
VRVRGKEQAKARSARRQRAAAVSASPRLVVRFDERSLTPYGGLAVEGELVRRIGLVGAIDAAVAEADGEGTMPFKRRVRGVSAGDLVVALSESLIVGDDAIQDLERLRSDTAGRVLRAVRDVPAASTACQLARRLERAHLYAAERAEAACFEALDRQLGRAMSAPVTLDFDSTQVEVYGRHKPGARVNYQGQLAYQPLVAVWAERGRVLGSELLAGSDATRGAETCALLSHALECLPAEHGAVAARFDSGFYSLEILAACRAASVSFSISVPRSSAIWSTLAGIGEDAWRPADGFDAAEVAETTYTPQGWRRASGSGEPLRLVVRRVSHRPDELAADPRARRRRSLRPEDRQLVLDDALAAYDELVYSYSFILSDHDPADLETVQLERHHRGRAQIEERIKEHKLGVSLRRLPLSDKNANRVWLHTTCLALNLLALLSDLAFGITPSPGMPRRRQAKFLRRMLLCVPARIFHHARQPILRLPAGIADAPGFARASSACRALAPPGAA